MNESASEAHDYQCIPRPTLLAKAWTPTMKTDFGWITTLEQTRSHELYFADSLPSFSYGKCHERKPLALPLGSASISREFRIGNCNHRARTEPCTRRSLRCPSRFGPQARCSRRENHRSTRMVQHPLSRDQAKLSLVHSRSILGRSTRLFIRRPGRA